jgi:hypothetical protein
VVFNEVWFILIVSPIATYLKFTPSIEGVSPCDRGQRGSQLGLLKISQHVISILKMLNSKP